MKSALGALLEPILAESGGAARVFVSDKPYKCFQPYFEGDTVVPEHLAWLESRLEQDGEAWIYDDCWRLHLDVARFSDGSIAAIKVLKIEDWSLYWEGAYLYGLFDYRGESGSISWQSSLGQDERADILSLYKYRYDMRRD